MTLPFFHSFTICLGFWILYYTTNYSSLKVSVAFKLAKHKDLEWYNKYQNVGSSQALGLF